MCCRVALQISQEIFMCFGHPFLSFLDILMVLKFFQYLLRQKLIFFC